MAGDRVLGVLGPLFGASGHLRSVSHCDYVKVLCHLRLTSRPVQPEWLTDSQNPAIGHKSTVVFKLMNQKKELLSHRRFRSELS